MTTTAEAIRRNARIDNLRRTIEESVGNKGGLDDHSMALEGIGWGGNAGAAGRELLKVLAGIA